MTISFKNYNEIFNYEADELTCDGRDNDCNGLTDEGHDNYDGDSLADCVDPDIDGDRILDNSDFVVGTSRDSDSNIPFDLVVAGKQFTGRGVNEGRQLIKLVDSQGDDLAWTPYLFNLGNVFDFRKVILRFFTGDPDEGEGSALVISGINAPDSVRKAYLLKILPTSSDMICVKTSDIREASQISKGCTAPDELIIKCDSRSYNGYRCERRVINGGDTYVIHGMNYYGVKEINVIQSDFTRDGKVDYDDFLLFADGFGVKAGQENYLPMFDLDYDNVIGFDDFLLFADQFGINAASQVRAKRIFLTEEFLLSNAGSGSEVGSCTSLADSGNTRTTGTNIGACEYGAEKCVADSSGVAWAEVLSPVSAEDEICDNVDNDCDGHVDENCSTAASNDDSSGNDGKSSSTGKKNKVRRFYYDADGDRYGVSEDYQAYSSGRYTALNGGDCSDNNANANPGAYEICDSVDNDCDSQVDEGNVCGVDSDSDNDGFSSFIYGGTDCNDNDATVNPNAGEFCDNKDNNCNNLIDEGVATTYYLDADDDGFGDADTVTKACSIPTGYAEDNNDCSDNNADVNPDATEQCNLIDDDCDNFADENNTCALPSQPQPEQSVPAEKPVEQPVCHVGGDFDNDNDVDYDDFHLFADNFGTTNPSYDFDNDNDVDFDDFLLFADQFGKTC